MVGGLAKLESHRLLVCMRLSAGMNVQAGGRYCEQKRHAWATQLAVVYAAGLFGERQELWVLGSVSIEPLAWHAMHASRLGRRSQTGRE